MGLSALVYKGVSVNGRRNQTYEVINTNCDGLASNPGDEQSACCEVMAVLTEHIPLHGKAWCSISDSHGSGGLLFGRLGSLYGCAEWAN